MLSYFCSHTYIFIYKHPCTFNGMVQYFATLGLCQGLLYCLDREMLLFGISRISAWHQQRVACFAKYGFCVRLMLLFVRVSAKSKQGDRI